MLGPRDFPPLVPQEAQRVQGRTAAKNLDTERARHLRALAMRTFYGTPVSTLAALKIISGGRKLNEATVWRWLKKAKSYPEAATRATLIEHLPARADVLHQLQSA